jgi:lactaldehyde dehydrogenase/glycolaldehyde dehydrogenase
MMTDYELYIDGRWQGTHERAHVFSPATERSIATVSVADRNAVDSALRAAKSAQVGWGRRTGVERGNVLRRWADLVDQHRERLAELISREEGKPLHEALGEVDFGNSWFRYYAEFDRRMEGEILSADQPNEQLWIMRQPVGVVVGIIPWNYPLAVAIRKIAPALIAGNAIVLKPHEDTPCAALELAKLANEAGVPHGVFNVLTGPGETVGDALVRHPIPGLITFTGSVETGKAIARNAADNLTILSLELGGKAPFIVMEDCDLDDAVRTAVASRFMNCGQVCICNERTYVQRTILEPFLDRMVEQVKQLKVGDPLALGTQIGPKVNLQELEKVEAHVQRAQGEGATILTGGGRLRGPGFERGFWFEPTVLTNVRQEMDIMQNEVFGPVIPVMGFDDFDQAMSLANQSRFGLAAYFYSDDVNRIMRAIRDLEFGELYINRGPGESIHALHGGWKQSGIGGDDGKHGLDHYLLKKTVYLRYQG